ncbi:hypothetical protein QAD02_007474 [Eretmocerus hayati]|uniref:Uncharacterized protein n=1 Tax=Eretmocerus hayati TaxID=131215 RepID=A0ACC2N432_9HYME|nr:hypothetical protein QAD02_007474 [Eretmocerus hayati]
MNKPSRKTAFKTCIVPTCRSNTTRTPRKIFIHVPDEQQLRNKWCEAVGRAPEQTRGNCYCCEDHFTLENDIAHYHIFNAIGGRKRVKPGVIPHRNLPSQLSTQINDCDEIIHELKKQKLVDDDTVDTPLVTVTDASNNNDMPDKNMLAATLDNQQIHVIQVANNQNQTISRDPLLNQTVQSCSSVDLQPVVSCAVSYENAPSVSDLIPGTTVHFSKKKEKHSQSAQTIRDVYDVGVTCKPKVKSIFTQVQEKILRRQNHKIKSIGVQTDIMNCGCKNLGSSKSLSKSVNGAVDEGILNTSIDTIESLCTDSSVYQASCESTTHTSEKETKLELLRQHVYDNVTKLVIENDPLLFLGVPKDALYVPHELSKITGISFKNICLTLKKIRQNHVNATLAYDFGYSDRHVARISESTVPVLAQVLKKLIFWPSKDTVMKNLPIAFRHKFREVQSIIDAFEIKIEKPGDALYQASSWSDYKHDNTWKYLISVDPSCTISFISEGYSGRISDTYLLEECGYLAKLPPGCEILADRGFKNASKLIEMHHCKIVVPCTVKAGEKCLEEDVRRSKEIASCRIHVERVIERIREFKFLDMNSCSDNKNIYLLDDIVIIAGALVNLQGRMIRK